MMSSMAGRFGFPGARPSNRKAAKGRKKSGKRTTGRGPTLPKVKGMPGGLPGMGGMADQFPGDFDPTKIKFPKQ